MSFRSGTEKYGDLALEKRFERQEEENRLLDTPFITISGVNHRNPIKTPTPSWWDNPLGWRQGNEFTDEEAIRYLNIALKYYSDQLQFNEYKCGYLGEKYGEKFYNADWCEATKSSSRIVGRIEKLLANVQNQIRIQSGSQISETFDFIPQVFAEEDPSVNSGLNGNNQESQMINYPQSANVRISFTSNVGGFSTSIPINNIGQLQALDNASNEWRYTLIGSSTNQPLMTLSGLINKINSQVSSVVTPQPQPQPPMQPPVITTVHIPPPSDVPFHPVDPETIRMAEEYESWEQQQFAKETEPGQINWIPEPFFSFINNVFRR